MLTTCPGLTTPILNVTVLPLIVKVPCPVVAPITSNMAGTGSVITTLVAASVPRLVTVIAKTTVSPGKAS